jgi:hypothetical protein
MPTVVAVVARRGRPFSGDATARVVGDVGADVMAIVALQLSCLNDRARACAWPFRCSGPRLLVADAATCS